MTIRATITNPCTSLSIMAATPATAAKRSPLPCQRKVPIGSGPGNGPDATLKGGNPRRDRVTNSIRDRDVTGVTSENTGKHQDGEVC